MVIEYEFSITMANKKDKVEMLKLFKFSRDSIVENLTDPEEFITLSIKNWELKNYNYFWLAYWVLS